MISGLMQKINRLPPNVKALSFWDIDDTLFKMKDAYIYIISKEEKKIIKKIPSSEFANYTPKYNEIVDFYDYRDSHRFFHNTEPLKANLEKAKDELESGNSMVVILTARGDMNNKELFLKRFQMCGLDMKKPHIHISRSGNLGLGVAAGKMQVVQECLNTKRFNCINMFDDSRINLTEFLKLKKEYPAYDFNAFLSNNGILETFNR